jgi:hypothetical protein
MLRVVYAAGGHGLRSKCFEFPQLSTLDKLFQAQGSSQSGKESKTVNSCVAFLRDVEQLRHAHQQLALTRQYPTRQYPVSRPHDK